MSWDDLDFYEPEPEEGEPGPADDPAVQQLEPLLLTMFETSPQAVFYENQLCVHFEARFFHWVTARTLKDLRLSGRIGSDLQELTPKTPLRFYYNKRNRYWRRRAGEIRKLVLAFSDPTFTSALGVQGELLIDGGLPRVGFQPLAVNVRTWEGRTWLNTNHDLDRVFTRDGLYYGAEIKNRLGYIPQAEFRAKLKMCEALNLIPLFIARMMPKTYIEDVRRAGGFSLIMKYQFYPISHRALANQIRAELGLPVDCPARLQDATLQRFLSWHEGHMHRSPSS